MKERTAEKSGPKERGGADVPEGASPWLPLSLYQRRYWLQHRNAVSPSQCNLGSYLELHGPIDVAAFHGVLTEVVKSADALQLEFDVGADEEPRQRFTPCGHVALPIIDLGATADPEEASEVQLRRLMWRPHAFPEGPLHRFALIRLAPERHIFFSGFHHLIADGWSMVLLGQRLVEGYDQYCRGTFRGASGGSFRKALEDAHAYLDSTACAADRDFWRSTAGGALVPLIEELAGRPGTCWARQNGSARRSVERREIEDPGSLFRSENLNLSHLLLGAVGVYCYERLGRTSFHIKMPWFNRDARTFRTVGAMSNTLPVPVRVDPDDTVLQHLKRLREHVAACQKHGRYPYVSLDATSLSGVADLLVNCILYRVQGAAYARVGRMGNFAPGMTRGLHVTCFDLGRTGKCTIEVLFNADRFDSAEMERLADRILDLMRRFAAGPQQRLRTLLGTAAPARPTVT